VISKEWFDANIPNNQAVSTAAQTHIATELGETALTTTYYNKLVAGTSTAITADEDAIMAEANLQASSSVYVTADDVRASGQIDGVAMVNWDDDTYNPRAWPILEDGQVFTCTWNHIPDTHRGAV